MPSLVIYKFDEFLAVQSYLRYPAVSLLLAIEVAMIWLGIYKLVVLIDRARDDTSRASGTDPHNGRRR